MVRLHDLPGVFADYVVGTVIVMTQMSMVGWVERQERRGRRSVGGHHEAGPGGRGYPAKKPRIQPPLN